MATAALAALHWRRPVPAEPSPQQRRTGKPPGPAPPRVTPALHSRVLPWSAGPRGAGGLAGAADTAHDGHRELRQEPVRCRHRLPTRLRRPRTGAAVEPPTTSPRTPCSATR
ncbi:hypothetical protein QJS66_22890 [Kocuria rhizophila]|nr:hypothetical protein QJS66_22890 [Kocuria rhizophila]